MYLVDSLTFPSPHLCPLFHMCNVSTQILDFFFLIACQNFFFIIKELYLKQKYFVLYFFSVGLLFHFAMCSVNERWCL